MRNYCTAVNAEQPQTAGAMSASGRNIRKVGIAVKTRIAFRGAFCCRLIANRYRFGSWRGLRKGIDATQRHHPHSNSTRNRLHVVYLHDTSTPA